MDKNLPNDPLEDFFKKSLEGMNELPSDDGWDVPSSNVWDRVEETIQPTAVIRPLNYWKWGAIAASVAVLFLVYQFVNQGTQIENLTTALEERKGELENVEALLQKEKEETESSFVQNENTEKVEEESVLEKSESEIVFQEKQKTTQNKITNTPNNSASFYGENKNGIGGKNNSGIPQIPSSENSNIVNNNSNVPLIFNEEKTGTESNEVDEQLKENTTVSNFSPTKSEDSNSDFSNNKKTQSLEVLPNRLFAIDEKENQERLEIESLSTSYLIPPKANHGFYVGAFVSQNRGELNIKARDNSMAKDRKNKIKGSLKNEKWTTGGGLKIGYQFNKNWSIETGVQYTNSKSYREHRIDKNFDPSNEMQNGTEFEGDYVLLLVTPIGDVESDATLSRSMSSSVPNQLPFRLDVKVEQNISFVGIPVLAKYSIRNRKWNFGTKAGLLANFITEADMEIVDIRSQLPQLNPRRHRALDKKELKDLKSTTVDWMVGVEVSRQLSESTSVFFEPSFSKSITPIFEKKNVETFPMMASVKLGVNYQF